MFCKGKRKNKFHSTTLDKIKQRDKLKIYNHTIIIVWMLMIQINNNYKNYNDYKLMMMAIIIITTLNI